VTAAPDHRQVPQALPSIATAINVDIELARLAADVDRLLVLNNARSRPAS